MKSLKTHVGIVLFFLIVFLVTATWESSTDNGVYQTDITIQEGSVEVALLRNPNRTRELHAGDAFIAKASQFILLPKQGNGAKINASEENIETTTSANPLSTNEMVGGATKERYWIVGYTKDEKGNPLPVTKVRAWLPPRTSLGAYSDKQGYYAIAAKQLGRYLLTSTPRETTYLQIEKRAELTKKATRPVVNFSHPKGEYILKGIVIDKITEKPIPDAKLSLGHYPQTAHEKQIKVKGQTGPDGRFTLRRIAQGTFFLNILADGYITYDASNWGEAYPLSHITFSETEPIHNMICKLDPGYAALVQVFDRENHPLESATVYFNLSNQSNYQYITHGKTGADGQCLATTLPNKRMTASVSKDGYAETYSRSFTPSSPKKPAIVKIRMEPASSISGRVVDESGEPIHGKRIYLNFIASGKYRNLFVRTLKKNGTFEYTNLGKGNYEIKIIERDFTGALDSHKELAKRSLTLEQGEHKKNVNIVVNMSP